MKIEPFKMEVTPEQSRQVQEIVFRNGGSWKGGTRKIICLTCALIFFKNGKLSHQCSNREYFDNSELSETTFADFMARYGGSQATQFDIMRKIVTIAEDAHKNGETGLCSVLLDTLADYISNNRPE